MCKLMYTVLLAIHCSRFLQGEGTDQSQVEKLRNAIQEGRPITIRLLNYRKDGTPFWNLLTVTPIRDAAGRVVKFVGVQVDVTTATEGKSVVDAAGVPILVHYDDRLRENVAKPVVDDVLHALQRDEGKEPKRLSRGTTGSGPGSPRALPRVALDLATTVERIQSNFVIADPTLPDCPIVFASDAFLELSGYRREEVLGRNCRFLQGPDTDRSTVEALKTAIREGREVTVRLLNYKKDKTPFWNMLTVAPIRDVLGNPRFLVGVQVDVTAQPTVEEAAPVGLSAASTVGAAVSVMGWGGVNPWATFHTRLTPPRPHRMGDKKVIALQEAVKNDGKLRLHQFHRVRQLGCGDVGMVDLVALGDTNGQLYALKSLEKQEMIDRNKVGRVKSEELILSSIDHPFLATCYGQLQTDTHLHFLLEYCSGGELYALLNAQPGKRLPEEAVKFYAAEVLLALQYLHLKGFIYRDLKPENILLHSSGHIKLTDFDLSCCRGDVHPSLLPIQDISGLVQKDRTEDVTEPSISSVKTDTGITENMKSLSLSEEDKESLQPSKHNSSETFGKGKHSLPPYRQPPLLLRANPEVRANSFVGTEEYLAPEIVTGVGHDGMVDWWSFGILIYELLFGTSPFRGNRRDATFENIVKQPLSFPATPQVSDEVKDLISRLLIKDPLTRFGSQAGGDEVKMHPWFETINWALIRMQPPPYIPGKRRRSRGKQTSNVSSGEAAQQESLPETFDGNEKIVQQESIGKLDSEGTPKDSMDTSGKLEPQDSKLSSPGHIPGF